MSTILEQLENALSDVQMSHVHCDNICGIVDGILNLKKQQQESEKELVIAIDKMCAELATEIRALQPYLTVSLRTNCCEIGYRTKMIHCQVKPYDGCWCFDSTDFGKMFSKRYPSCRQLSCPLGELAANLVEYFNSQYRSLA